MIVAPGSAMIVAPGSAIIAGPASALYCPSDDPAYVEQNSDTETFLQQSVSHLAKSMIVHATVHTARRITACEAV